MKRLPFVLRFRPGMKDAGLTVLSGLFNEMRGVIERQGIENFSVWSIQDFLFCYGEYPDSITPARSEIAAREAWANALSPSTELFAAPAEPALMYHNIGIVRQDKSLIRHRVFATKLKEGCLEEYRRRHDALIAARGDVVSEGPESNFTIWAANGYIFGYCELVKSFDREMTGDEKAATIAWETRQLEIMDWLTDDVDWITGEKHEPVRLVCKQ